MRYIVLSTLAVILLLSGVSTFPKSVEAGLLDSLKSAFGGGGGAQGYGSGDNCGNCND
ncbi:MAG: hypothetical protein RLZZ234_196, partial [Candidatus Parcubacteria bacterium]